VGGRVLAEIPFETRSSGARYCPLNRQGGVINLAALSVPNYSWMIRELLAA